MSLFPVAQRMYQRFVRKFDGLPTCLHADADDRATAMAGYRLLAVNGGDLIAGGSLCACRCCTMRCVTGAARLILGTATGSEEARTFYASTRRLLDYVGGIVVVLVALKLTDLNLPLMRLLSVKLATLGSRPLTSLVLIEAAAIVAGFVFVAQLLRDYLQFQVYPALNVDVGVARAIDTFIVYSLAAIGGLAALEAVGLGVGTITLFAGAIGVGLGFGLQSIATISRAASPLSSAVNPSRRRGHCGRHGWRGGAGGNRAARMAGTTSRVRRSQRRVGER